MTSPYVAESAGSRGTPNSDLMPDAEFLMLGVEEPASRIHAPDESVHPEELRRTALALALFLASFGDLSDSEPAMTG